MSVTGENRINASSVLADMRWCNSKFVREAHWQSISASLTLLKYQNSDSATRYEHENHRTQRCPVVLFCVAVFKLCHLTRYSNERNGTRCKFRLCLRHTGRRFASDAVFVSSFFFGYIGISPQARASAAGRIMIKLPEASTTDSGTDIWRQSGALASLKKKARN